MSSLATELPREINRVRQIQDQFKELRGMRNVIVEPQIAMMEHDIQAAIQASSADPTVPDLYEGIAGNDHGDMPAGVAIAIALGMVVRRLGFLGWVAIGLCVGLLI